MTNQMSMFDLNDPVAPPPLMGSVIHEGGHASSPSALQQQLSAGVELIVRGLDRTQSNSAVTQLQQILRELCNGLDPSDLAVYPPIRDSGSNKALDYAIIGFRGEARKNPRADHMNLLKEKLKEYARDKGIEVDWNISPGYDKARYVWFRDTEDGPLGQKKLQKELEKYLEERARIPFQACTPSGGNMVRLYLSRKQDVAELLSRDVVIGNSKFRARAPTFIQPIYAMEIGIVGVEDLNDPEALIGEYIEGQYRQMSKTGRVIRSQRLALNDQVYCVVVESTDIATRLLQDPFLIFEGLEPKPSSPQYLYRLNQRGYPNSFQRSKVGSEQQQVQKNWDSFEQRTNQFLSAFNQMENRVTVLAEQQARHDMQINITLQCFLQSSILFNQLENDSRELRQLQWRFDEKKGEAQRTHNKAEKKARAMELRNLKRDIEDVKAHSNTVQQRLDAVQSQGFSPLLPATNFLPPPPQLPQGNPAEATPQFDEEMFEEDEQEPAAGPSNIPGTSAASNITSAQQLPPFDEEMSNENGQNPVQSATGSKSLSGSVGMVVRLPHTRTHLGAHYTIPSQFHPICILTALFVSISLTAAAVPPYNFNVLSLNMNGFANVAKIDAATRMIQREQPSAFVLQETKSSIPASKQLYLPQYQLFDSPGRSTGHRNQGKWGVIMGIRKNLCTISKVSTPNNLSGRAIVADMLLPTASGTATPHRLIGLYAPWEPGGEEGDAVNTFWTTVIELCLDAPAGFTIIGDLNVVIAAIETSSHN
ncbi:hypothetical protein H0H93_007458, partial [Arthromyces matolae]